jgi:hypothetical protein
MLAVIPFLSKCSNRLKRENRGQSKRRIQLIVRPNCEDSVEVSKTVLLADGDTPFEAVSKASLQYKGRAAMKTDVPMNSPAAESNDRGILARWGISA